MKKIISIVITAGLILLAGCGHEHQWTEATCTEPRTCTECGATEGEPYGHKWVEATCSEAKHCSVCGEKEGETLAHTWEEATCTKAKTCKVCGYVDGEPLGHDWTEATHEAPKTCKRCGETEGDVLLYEVPAGFTADYEFGEFSRFNSFASENGLGGTMIWVDGSYDNISNLDLSADIGQNMTAYICTLVDQDNNKWLVQIDLDYYTSADKYKELCGHSLCITGEYTGYSQLYEMPAFIVEKIFDKNTGNVIIPTWYNEYVNVRLYLLLYNN